MWSGGSHVHGSRLGGTTLVSMLKQIHDFLNWFCLDLSNSSHIAARHRIFPQIQDSFSGIAGSKVAEIFVVDLDEWAWNGKAIPISSALCCCNGGYPFEDLLDWAEHDARLHRCANHGEGLSCSRGTVGEDGCVVALKHLSPKKCI